MHLRETTCHPDRAHWALGLCASCYTIQRQKGWPNGKPKSVRRAFASCHKDKKHFARGMCETCYSAWKRANRSGRQIANTTEWFRDRHFRSKFGITAAERDRLVAAHGGKCCLCGQPDGKGRGKVLHIDHCHQTGRIRGVLCGSCNQGIGLLRDDPALLARAIAYLQCGPTSAA